MNIYNSRVFGGEGCGTTSKSRGTKFTKSVGLTGKGSRHRRNIPVRNSMDEELLKNKQGFDFVGKHNQSTKDLLLNMYELPPRHRKIVSSCSQARLPDACIAIAGKHNKIFMEDSKPILQRP